MAPTARIASDGVLVGMEEERRWIPDQVGDDSKGRETTCLENLGYQRAKRVDGRFGLSFILHFRGRIVFFDFFRFFLLTM